MYQPRGTCVIARRPRWHCALGAEAILVRWKVTRENAHVRQWNGAEAEDGSQATSDNRHSLNHSKQTYPRSAIERSTTWLFSIHIDSFLRLVVRAPSQGDCFAHPHK